ncbi:hypothetical protein B0H34DRAFT_727223 [Crassisporium funariophilum]|nr:hypothetical protein B0H34DRAFT_727223 [Crassisporium funariophilum]
MRQRMLMIRYSREHLHDPSIPLQRPQHVPNARHPQPPTPPLPLFIPLLLPLPPLSIHPHPPPTALLLLRQRNCTTPGIPPRPPSIHLQPLPLPLPIHTRTRQRARVPRIRHLVLRNRRVSDRTCAGGVVEHLSQEGELALGEIVSAVRGAP